MKAFALSLNFLLLAQRVLCANYPIVLINGWGGSSLDGTSTEETKDLVSTKCGTEFADKRIWISLNTALDFVNTPACLNTFIISSFLFLLF